MNAHPGRTVTCKLCCYAVIAERRRRANGGVLPLVFWLRDDANRYWRSTSGPNAFAEWMSGMPMAATLFKEGLWTAAWE